MSATVDILAPMGTATEPLQILTTHVAVEDTVAKHQVLISAMHEGKPVDIVSPDAGTIDALLVSGGQTALQDDVLAKLRPSPDGDGTPND